MKYRIKHSTEYRYGDPVPLCHNVVRLRPRETARQTCEQSELTVTPAPAARRDRVDFFGNHATWFCIQEPHTTMTIEAVSEVDVHDVPPPADPGHSTPWEQVRDALAAAGTPELVAVKDYTFDSPYIHADAELAAYAQPSFAPARPVVEALLDLTQRIFHDFIFDTRASTIGTPVLDVLRNRRGVCQDFANLQIGCLRSIGLAARYVSGYIMTLPPPGQTRLVGCDASHAWVGAFVPGLGWLDFDPTNGMMPDGDHVTLGWARDYDEIAPLKGVLVGGQRHTMYYGVTMEPVDETDAVAKTVETSPVVRSPSAQS